jgi:hypothetical protein
MLEGSSRLGVLSGLSPFSFVDMLHATSGGFDTQWFPFLLVARLFVCLDFGPCPLFLFLSFLGAFFLQRLARFHHSLSMCSKLNVNQVLINH